MTPFLERPKILALRRRWTVRANRFATTEVIAGAVIMVTWSLLATIGARWLPITLIAVAIGLWLHLAAVETGSHLMMWMATGLVLGYVVLADAGFFGGLSAASYTAAAVSAVVHNELIRVSHARRRRGLIQDLVFQKVAVGLALVAVTTVGSMAVAQRLAEADDRAWWWMPVAIGVVLVLGAILSIAPARNAPPGQRDRWRPGDRIPPQPLGREEGP